MSRTPLRVYRVSCTALAITFAVLRSAAADDQLDLSPHWEPNTFTRVTIECDAGGSNLVRAAGGATDSAASAATIDRKLPMSVSARLQYDELRLARPADGPSSVPVLLAVRFYDRTEAVLKVDDTGLAPRLAENRRLIVVESGPVRPTLYAVEGPLQREQLDLIDIAGNTCLIDELLPTAPVTANAPWKADAAVIGGLLTLDSVAVCEVESVLDDYNANFAKVRVAGVIHGTADGTATQQEIRGVYLFDRRLRRITRLNLAIRESRSIGGATPGLQGVAKMQIKIDPIDGSPQLTETVVAEAKQSAASPHRNLLYESAALGFRVEHDRRWFVTGEGRETASLRRVDGNDVIAQCTVTRLPARSLGRQIPLEQFQKDVAYSLGKSFGQLVSSRQWLNAQGHRCFEVVVRGTVEETPVEWHHFLVAQDSGHRVSLAFTIEGPQASRLNQADRGLVDALQLLPSPTTPTAARHTESAPK